MKQETIFLKVVVFLMGIPILAPYIFLFPWMVSRAVELNPELAYLQYLFIICLYATAIPFYFALYQTIKILGYIDKNKAFSNLSVKALKYIKYCAITISILCSTGMPLLFIVADDDDAPGIILLGLIVIFASIVIAVFAAVLQKLLKNAIEIKSENELTI
ncbi:MAG: YoaS [Clostridiales bacterium]|jgi:hypothetical protein|nr:YoaS [Clostridiales bacterium]